MIEFSEVSFSYPNETKALQDINLFIDKGEFVFITGSTGSGKSTLLKLLYRENLPQKGEIYINNHDITEIPRYKIPFLRRKLGVIFQDFKLLDYKSVGENVSFALEVTGHPLDKIPERVDMVLEVVGMKDKKDRLPEEISGGEKQLTSIARAIIHNPQILIADEPTGNLDPTTAENIIGALDYINSRGTTVIVATHNETLVKKFMKRVIALEEGKIVSDKGQAHKIPELVD
ncbi:MAG: cell division ATP-binding protein FtsE [Candidatus Eremiobacteraeota bacterium]|nr:cell division ATP-binding protein FtsE [Candidatus Eremiobacteraeota bacterium]